MTRHSEHHPSALRVLRGLFLFYLVFVVYGSLVPLAYVAQPWDTSVARLLALRDQPLDFSSRSDWATNLVLFIPLTFLAGQAWGSRARGMAQGLLGLLLVVAASGLAIGIEFTQMFFPPRTPSPNDIVALGISGAIGVGLHWALGPRVAAWVAGYWQDQVQGEKLARLLKGYLFVLLAFNVMPLDLTISPVEIYHKWSAGRFILLPFAGLHGTGLEMLYQVLTDVLIWVPAGALWALQPGPGPSLAVSAMQVVRKALLAAAVIEGLQLFVLSRTTDITSVGLAGVGAGLGALAVLRLGAQGLARIPSSTWMAWWMLWLVAIVNVFWLPFDFDLYRLTGSAFTEAFTRAPLTNYYYASEFMALNEVLRKTAFFVPGGLLLGLAGLARNRRGSRPSKGALLLLVLLAFGLETGQLMLPGRTCDLTDFLLQSLGGMLGYAMARWMGPPAPGQHRPATSATPPASAPAAPARLSGAPATPGPAMGYRPHLLWLGLTALALGVLLRLPFMPYNLRELVAPGAWGAVSVLGLALALYWMASGPLLLLATHRRRFLLALPLSLVGHGLVSWCLLRIAVPLESIHDVVGSPVLHWPWEWELLGRYLGLHAAILLQVLGGVLVVRTLLRSSTLPDLVYWLLASAVLAWPLYTLNVLWAATDNLVELMADNASFAAASAMAGGLWMVCVAGSALSAAGLRSVPRLRLLGVALAASAIATALFWAGAEHFLVKYGKAFSAFQFLLSADREHYAHGLDLALRYAAALAGAMGGLAALQWMAWRGWLRQAVPQRPAPRAKRVHMAVRTESGRI